MVSSVRRFGLENSETRAALIDAAERIMCEEGYAAVTSRRIASKAGLKPQLVHYYFRTMDELFLAMLRRRTEQNRAEVQRALLSSNPVRALWDMSTDRQGASLMEFAALANHRKAIRVEIARYAEEIRASQAEAFARVLGPDSHAPMAWSMLMTSISQVLVMERALGVSGGHAEMLELVQGYLDRFENRGAAPPLQELAT